MAESLISALTTELEADLVLPVAAMFEAYGAFWEMKYADAARADLKVL